MEPSKRIKLITELSNILEEEEWGIIDLTLKQFGLPFTDQWSGSKKYYVVSMIQDATDECLGELARHLGISDGNNLSHSYDEIKVLIQMIDLQKALMVNVSTGGQRIQQVNDEYKERREEIFLRLQNLNIEDPNPYVDLWAWYGKWSDGSLPTYQSRRSYVSELYQSISNQLSGLSKKKDTFYSPVEPTGWVRVDRNVDKIVQTLQKAKNEEDFQSVGLLCRETIISLAQAVYIQDLHNPLDGVAPSETDAKRMLDSYISTEFSGSSNEELRKYVKDSYQLAVVLQHKRNAGFRESALCAEATRSLVNLIAVISGRRDP